MRYLVIRERIDDLFVQEGGEAFGLVRIPETFLVRTVYPGPGPGYAKATVTTITKAEYESYEALGVLDVYDWHRRTGSDHFVDVFNTEHFTSCPRES